MKRFHFVLTSLLLLTLSSCREQPIELQDTDYLIFGQFYGECAGEGCIEIFKLEQNRLSEDQKDTYPNSTDFYEGNYVELSAQQFALTKDLIGLFPRELLNEKSRVIGQPDAGDWGGFYIEYKSKGIRQFWLLDKMKRNVPEKYYGFIDTLNEKIKQLR